MEKEFNVTGTCIPEIHYMVDISNKLDLVIKLIEKGKYFVINRPRQKKMFILELKIWYGEEYHKKGQIQLGEYLEQYGMDQGYLLIFDFRKEIGLAGKVEEVAVKIGEKQKKLIEVYC